MMLFIRLAILLNNFRFISSQIEIEGNFKECIIGSNLNMLQFDDECFRDPDDYVKSFDTDFPKIGNNPNFPAFVFSKHNFILESKGFECKMLVHRFRYSRDFLFNKYIQSSNEIVKLSRADCLSMVIEKQCGKFGNKQKMQMTSNSEYIFKEKVTEEFPIYFGTIEKEFYECKFIEKIVLAQTLTDSIFHNSIEPCFAEDEVCYFADSTVIWEREDIKRCPYERLIELPLLNLKKKTNSTIFYSDTYEYLFKIISKKNECGFDFYLTTEGMYLSFYKSDFKLREQLNALPLSKYNINHFTDRDKNDLILAENDYTHLKMTEMTLDVACSLFLNTIQMNLDQKDKFLNINYLGKFCVLYRLIL